MPKNVKGGHFGFFKHSFCCKIEGPFGATQKFSKNVLVPKKVKNTKIAKGKSGRGFFFVLGEFLTLRVYFERPWFKLLNK